MSIEVSCGNCQGRLLIEQVGVVVACPHCDTHLTIDAPAETAVAVASPEVSTSPSPAAVSSEPVAEGAAPATLATEVPGDANPLAAAMAPAELPGEQMPFLGDATPPGSAALSDPVFPSETPTAAAAPVFEPVNQVPQFGFGTATVGGPETVVTGAASVESSQPTFPAVSEPVPADAFAAAVEPTAFPAAAQVSAPSPVSTPVTDAPVADASSTAADLSRSAPTFTPAPRSEEMVPKRLFKMALSYGIAATLAVLYLSFQVLNGTSQQHQLESLPDVVPPKTKTKSGTQIGYKLIPEDLDVPPGHSLSLGEEQRFGNLLVTPLRVSREPVEFVHFMGDENRTKAPGKDILKLWLRFENVSEDQEIAPLDGLVFRRGTSKGDDFPDMRSNTFLCRLSEKNPDGERVLAYELNTDDVWLLKDQRVEIEIKPGESIESYVPSTEEGLSELLSKDEELVWRVHFRKGYSPKNYGVTTVLEVRFSPSEIGGKSAPPADNSDAKSA